MNTCKEILKDFCIEEDILKIEPYGGGHINDTFRITCPENKYILQRINHNIFKKPEHVMENITNVCNHIRAKLIDAGEDEKRGTLTFIPTRSGEFLSIHNGNYYRMYLFLENAVSYQTIEDPMHFYNAGKAFGKFQNMLSDFPAEKLHETIANFHNTVDRLNNLKIAISENKAGRKDSVAEEIKFVLDRADDCSVVMDLLKSGDLPLRVTHNDTKLNNILLDEKTGEAICVIDLDTVMPSSLLCDFGDAIRFGANTAEEDEKDLSLVDIDINLFEKFTQGFLEATKGSITAKEVEYLAFSAKLLTLECGIRFLTDYLDGDVYFKIHREGHNLDRARNQFKLVSEMENHEEEMKSIVNRIYNSL